MGALRAAELDSFGMRGIGDVYRAYADGMLEDDDEVAVAHADAEHGFRALSDAMVDVRATLEAALAAGVIGAGTADSLVVCVKSTFYAERALVAALDRNNDEHERLRAWLPAGRVERKREDALELVRAIRRPRRRWPPAVQSRRGRCSERATGRKRGVRSSSRGATSPGRLQTRRSRRCSTRPASMRKGSAGSPSLLLARLQFAAAAGVDVSPWAHQAALEEERRARGLLEPEDVDTWLAERDLDRGDLPEDVARRLAVLRWARDAHRDAVAGEVALALRSDDAYAGLAARALRKRDVLESLRPVARSPPTSSSSSRTSASGWDVRCRSRSTPGRPRTAGAASPTSCGRSGTSGGSGGPTGIADAVRARSEPHRAVGSRGMRLCMFHPISTPMERGWVGRVEGDEVVHLAAQTLQHLFTGGGTARDHARYPLADVVLLSPLASPPSVRVFNRDGSFELPIPRRSSARARESRRPATQSRSTRGLQGSSASTRWSPSPRRAAARPCAHASEGPGLRHRARSVVHDAGRDAGGDRPAGVPGGATSAAAADGFDWKSARYFAGENTRLRVGDLLLAPAALVADVQLGPVTLDVGGLGRLELTVEAR